MESRTGWRREGTSHFYKLIALHPSTCFSIRVSLMRTSRQTEPARPTPGIHRNDNKVSPSTTLRRSYRCRQLIRKTQSRDAPAKSTRSEVAVASSRPLRRRSLAAVNRGRAGSVRQATHSSEGNHRRADGQRWHTLLRWCLASSKSPPCLAPSSSNWKVSGNTTSAVLATG